MFTVEKFTEWFAENGQKANDDMIKAAFDRMPAVERLRFRLMVRRVAKLRPNA